VCGCIVVDKENKQRMSGPRRSEGQGFEAFDAVFDAKVEALRRGDETISEEGLEKLEVIAAKAAKVSAALRAAAESEGPERGRRHQQPSHGQRRG
jgi:hypothetical protein